MDDATSKTCSECRATLPRTAFGRSARSTDGLRSQCLECNRARVRKSYTFAGPPRTITCARCGASHETRNPRARYCSDSCKRLAAEERRTARAADRSPRSCGKCGATVTTTSGTPVCGDCRVDKRNRPGLERRRTLRRYGLTQADWDRLVEKQGDRCAICRTDTPGGRGELWHIDHCHETGQVRGLLCHMCNVGIGNLGDDPKRLEAAARYVREHLQLSLIIV